MPDYYTLLTDTGLAKDATASNSGSPLQFSTICAGTGSGSAYYDLYGVAELKTLESLVAEVWSAPINAIYTDPDNPNWIIIEGIIPSETGGWDIREVGIKDNAGDLIAVGRYPQTYKPQLVQGASQDLKIKFILEVTNAENVTLLIDPAVVMASREYVDLQIDTLKTLLPQWGHAQQVGVGLAISANDLSLCALNNTDIAFFDSNTDELRTFRWDGATWRQEGASLRIPESGIPAIATLGNNIVAFHDNGNGELRTYQWDGATWRQAGNGLPLINGNVSMAALNHTDLAFAAGAQNELRTYRWDGSNWAQIGNALAIISSGVPAISAMNQTDIAIYSGAGGALRKYRWNGTNWVSVGNALTIAGTVNSSIAALNNLDIAFLDDALEKLSIYRFFGSDWRLVFEGIDVPGIAGSVKLTALNATDVVVMDNSVEQLSTYRFNLAMGNPHALALS